MSLSSTSLPKPKYWQDFENKMRVLFSCVLGDPNTQINGRSGQNQNGVDIFGYRNADCLVGIQCKKKWENKVTDTELRREVNRAKSFKPRLSEYFLVTTAQRDTKIQETARLISEELRNTPHPFRVVVWGWEDIEEHAASYEKAWKAFDPTWNPIVEEEVKRLYIELKDIKGTENKLETRTLSPTNNPSTLGMNESEENSPLHGKITMLQRFIDEGFVQPALEKLIKLKTEEWPTASRSERYRILVGISAAKLKHGQYSDAGNLLLDAYIECPEHKKSLGNKAKAYLLLNNDKEAEKIARELLKTDNSNADAAGTLIQALIHDNSGVDPLKELPVELHATKEVQIAYAHFLRCKDDFAWIETARKAAVDYPESQLLKVLAAEAVLEQLTHSEQDSIAGGILHHLTNAEVHEAAEVLYSEAHAALDKGYALIPSLAHNAALALRFVDDISKAKEILDGAIKQHPTEEMLRLQRAIIALSENIPKAAIAVLPQKPTEPEAIGVLAQAYTAEGQYDEALSLIRDTDLSNYPVHVEIGFWDVRIQIHLAKGEKQAAIDLINQKVTSDPENITIRTIQIRTYRVAGDNCAALKAFEDAVEMVNDETSLLKRLSLSFEARKLGRGDEIVKLLNGHVATNRASEGLYLLIASAINSGCWVTANEILNAVSEELRRTEWIQQADAILAINTGSLAAEEKIGRYLRSNPNDLQMILALIGIWQRAGRNAEIRDYLAQLNLDEMDGCPEMHIQIATMINHYWDSKIGLNHGYKVLMDNWDKPKVHLAYQSLFFLDDKIGEAMPLSDVVGEQTVVCVSTAEGDRRYRIEKENHTFFEDERLPPETDLAQILIGRKPGEKFNLTDRIVSREVQILWIKSVHLDAFHLSLNHFNERFPHAEGLMKFSFDPSAADPFEDIRLVTKECAEAHQRILGVYQTKNLPLSFAAALIGKDPIDAWKGLPTVNVQFQVCRGTFQEREEAFQIIDLNKRKGCIVDAITLSAIRRLGLEKVVSEVCGKIHTTQSVIDLFSSRAIEAKLNIGKTKGFVAWRDGQLVYENQSEEILHHIADDCAIEASWVKEIAAVLPSVPKKDLSKDVRSLIKMIGHAACDAAFAADGNEFLLLSEDMGYRIWAKAAFNVHTTWLQPVMLIARKTRIISDVDYCEASNLLVLGGHYFTSLDVTCLMNQAIKDNFCLTYELSRLIMAVGGPQADIQTNIGIVIVFINAVLNECNDLFKVKRIISETFNSITKGRSEDQTELVNLIWRQLISNKKSKLSDHVIGWLAGHSIGMPYFGDLLDAFKR